MFGKDKFSNECGYGGGGGGSGGSGGRVSTKFNFGGKNVTVYYNPSVLTANGIPSDLHEFFIKTRVYIELYKMNSTEKGFKNLSRMSEIEFDFCYSKKDLANIWNSHHQTSEPFPELLGLTFAPWASSIDHGFDETSPFTTGDLPDVSNIIYLASDLLFDNETLEKLVFNEIIIDWDLPFTEITIIRMVSTSPTYLNASLFYVMSHELTHKSDGTRRGLPKSFDSERSAVQSADEIFLQFMNISKYMKGYLYDGFYTPKK